MIRILLMLSSLLLVAVSPAQAEKADWTEWRVAEDADGAPTPIEWRARHDGHNPFMEKKAKPAERWELEFRNTGKHTHWFFFKLTASGLAPKYLGPFGMSKRLDPGETAVGMAYNGATKGQAVELWYEYRKTAKLMRVIAQERALMCGAQRRTYSATLIAAGVLRIKVSNEEGPAVITTLKLTGGKALSSADVRVLGSERLRDELAGELRGLVCATGEAKLPGVMDKLLLDTKRKLLDSIKTHHEKRCGAGKSTAVRPHDCYRRTPTIGLRG